MEKETEAQEADEILEPPDFDNSPQDLGDDQVWPDAGPVAPDATGSPNQ